MRNRWGGCAAAGQLCRWNRDRDREGMEDIWWLDEELTETGLNWEAEHKLSRHESERTYLPKFISSRSVEKKEKKVTSTATTGWWVTWVYKNGLIQYIYHHVWHVLPVTVRLSCVCVRSSSGTDRKDTFMLHDNRHRANDNRPEQVTKCCVTT